MMMLFVAVNICSNSLSLQLACVACVWVGGGNIP